MNLQFPASDRLSTLWFAQVTPLLHLKGIQVPAQIETAHPNGGTFRIPRSAVGEEEIARHLELEFSDPEEDRRIVLRCAITRSLPLGEDQLRIDLVFLQIVENRAGLSDEVREAEAIPCASSFRPLLWGDHPWYFRYRLQLSVQCFLRGGAEVRFDVGTKGVIGALELDLQAVIPGMGLFPIRARVNTVGEDRAVLEWIDPSRTFMEAISRYLFTVNPELDPLQLEAAGYPFPEFDFAAVFGYAHREEELLEMYRLRLDAYRSREGSTLTAVDDPLVMRDEFDAHAIVLSVRVGGRPVGTTRLVFNNGSRDRSEIARFVELPDWLWDAGFVELSRSATCPKLRGRDVFSSLRRHALRIAYQSGFRYILADCEGHLLQPYLKRGAQEMGITFVHPLEGKTLHVLLYDIAAILEGRVGDREVWNRFWKPMVDFLGGGSAPSAHQKLDELAHAMHTPS